MHSKAVLRAWISTRLAMRLSPTGLARRRQELWQRLQPALGQAPALASFAGHALKSFPVTEVADIRRDYGQWNSLGLSHRALHEAAASAEAGGSGEVAPGVIAGYSTGTLGQRGLFVASEAERASYIGQSLARLVPVRSLLEPVRVALLLRANSRLYADVASRRISFSYAPLDTSKEEAVAWLAAYQPTIIIAPSHRLVEIAGSIWKGELSLPALKQCFFGAEPMGDAERAWVSDVMAVRPDPIYQATEGFLAASCRHGQLHLNEHSMDIELEAVVGTAGFRPIVTDLLRRSQPIVRVRTDDFVELGPRSCRCGYAGRVILPVAGRVPDLWRFGDRSVSPRQVSDAIDAAVGVPTLWQADASAAGVKLSVDPACGRPHMLAAAAKLRELLGSSIPVTVHSMIPPAPAPKRRRLRWLDEYHG